MPTGTVRIDGDVSSVSESANSFQEKMKARTPVAARAGAETGSTIRAHGLKIVAELKRDTHADVWTAIEGQLDRLYTRDPDTAGYGIFVVFWYGDKRKGRLPAGPNGQRPGSAADMERMLRESVPEDKKERIAAIVLDVSCTVPVGPIGGVC